MDAELPTTAQVRRLLDEQLPAGLRDLAGAPVRFAARGWDNAVFRVGEDRAARLPLRAAAVPLLAAELRWTAEAAAPLVRLGLGVPVPRFAGRPGAGLPWPWTLVDWVPGEPVALLPVVRRDRPAADLARALAALHRPAPAGAPHHPRRGVDLGRRLAAAPPDWSALARRLGPGTAARLREVVAEGVRAAPWTGPPLWLHGDPHPWNLVHRDGRLSGLVDFGDVCAGDPASDLATAWLSLDARQRAGFRAVVDAAGNHDDAVWVRAAAWAALYTAALAGHPGSWPRFGPVAAHAAAQLTARGGA
ncbi:phosphotransferase [Kocuria flava]|uniref:phosphotransferase n=1 Tax=Kocuria flava TaxID=446860 RepID=UPI002F9498C8